METSLAENVVEVGNANDARVKISEEQLSTISDKEHNNNNNEDAIAKSNSRPSTSQSIKEEQQGRLSHRSGGISRPTSRDEHNSRPPTTSSINYNSGSARPISAASMMSRPSTRGSTASSSHQEYIPANQRPPPDRDFKQVSIRPDIECSVCNQKYVDPVLLTCLHSFCRKCLEPRTEHRGPKLIVLCPVCGKESPFEHLQVNIIAQNAVDTLLLRGDGIILCGLCDEEVQATAISRCTECNLNMCDLHEQAHKRSRATKSHKLLPISELRGKDAGILHRPAWCSVHSSEIVTLYCHDCDQAICKDCAATEHKQHDFVFLNEVGEEHKIAINQMLAAAESRMPDLVTILENVDDMILRVHRKTDVVASEIKDFFQEFEEMLQERERVLLQQVEAAKDAKLRILRNQRDGLQELYSNLSTCCKFTKVALERGSDVEILALKHQMAQRLEALRTTKIEREPMEDDGIEFNNQVEEQIIEDIQALGDIEVDSKTDPRKCFAKGDGISKAVWGNFATFQLTCVNYDGIRQNRGGETIEILLITPESEYGGEFVDRGDGTYDCQYIAAYQGDMELHVTVKAQHIQGSPFHIYVSARDYKSLGIPHRVFGAVTGRGEILSPAGVCVNRNNHIIVSECRNHRIFVFRSDGALLRRFGTLGDAEGCLQIPYGVAVAKDGSVLVSEGGNHRVSVFHSDGRFSRCFGSFGENPGEFNQATGIAIGRNGAVFVADYGNHRIQVFDSRGKVIKMFGTQGDEPGEFQCPVGLAIDENGLLYVADQGNHRIQVFTSDGILVRMFGRHGTAEGEFQNPYDVAVNTEGHIIVADNNNHRIQIFRADGGYVTQFGGMGTAEGQLLNPVGICVDNKGRIVVADQSNHRIQVF